MRQLTGIAAILRFPMPDIEDLSDSDGEEQVETETKANGHICNNTEPDEEARPKAIISKTSTASVKCEATVSTSSIKIEASTKVSNKKASRYANREGPNEDYDMFDFNDNNNRSNYDDEFDYY